MTLQSFKQAFPKVGANTYVDSSAKIIGKVTIAEDCSIWPMVVMRGDVNHITIGKGTNIQDNTVCHVAHAGPYNPPGQSLTVGNYVTVGHSVILHACHIEDYCLIGMGAIILDNVFVPSYTIIAAGSLVPPHKVLEPGVWVGNLARKKRDLTDKEKAFMEYSAQHYIKLKNDYLNESNS